MAREILPQVHVTPAAAEFALGCIQALNIPSHRAEITLLEAARARAASDERTEVTVEDVRTVAPLALRQRRSAQLEAYAQGVAAEDAAIAEALARISAIGKDGQPTRRRSHAPRTENRKS